MAPTSSLQCWWPPNSLDLNPVDYAVSGALQQRMYCDDSLKQAIVDDWCALSRKFIDRLECVVQQN